jgi:hypothetical protein
MFQKYPILMAVMSGVAAGVLFLVSVSSLLWAAFCFLGGPDGDIGSRESIIWGSGFLTFAVVIGFIGILLARVALRAKRGFAHTLPSHQ